MEIDGRDFLNTPPVKTVRFGGNVAETLAKYKQVSKTVMSIIFIYCEFLKKVLTIHVLLFLFEGRFK